MSRLTDQVMANLPSYPMTAEDWKEIQLMNTRPVPVLANPQFEVPSDVRPTDLFAVHCNRCSVPGYRFIRKNNLRQMLMFVDGACLDNGSPNARAGWAVCVGPQTVVSGRLEPPAAQTSNRAELRSATIALGLRVWKGEGFSSVMIASESEYVVKGYCEWLAAWKKSNWKTAKSADVLNKDLWEELDWRIHKLAREGVHVWFWRIPREWNEADVYARQAAVSFPRCCRRPSSLMNMVRTKLRRSHDSWALKGYVKAYRFKCSEHLYCALFNINAFQI